MPRTGLAPSSSKATAVLYLKAHSVPLTPTRNCHSFLNTRGTWYRVFWSYLCVWSKSFSAALRSLYAHKYLMYNLLTTWYTLFDEEAHDAIERGGGTRIHTIVRGSTRGQIYATLETLYRNVGLDLGQRYNRSYLGKSPRDFPVFGANTSRSHPTVVVGIAVLPFSSNFSERLSCSSKQLPSIAAAAAVV